MSESTGKAPIKRISDGALTVKIWEQRGGENGQPFLTTTIGRTYKDRESGEFRESRSLTRGQLLKLPALAMEASQFIRGWEAKRREQARQYEAQAPLPMPDQPQGGLAAQRDQAMANARDPQPMARPAPDLAPEQ